MGACTSLANGTPRIMPAAESKPWSRQDRVTLFRGGDVMKGRGIDQILPHPNHPRLHESYLKSALDYVDLAERVNGPIPRPVDGSYIWGGALPALESRSPDFRIINLETAITSSEDFWPGKGIHYRMHPRHVSCLTAAEIDCCVLSNNHVLDWGLTGLQETLTSLETVQLPVAGAGRNRSKAEAPAVLPGPEKSRVLVFGLGISSSGIPPRWSATNGRAGIHFLEQSSAESVKRIVRLVERWREENDLVIASLHWGGNWGYAVPHSRRAFAHRLIDEAGVDIVHGHSSHHPPGNRGVSGQVDPLWMRRSFE